MARTSVMALAVLLGLLAPPSSASRVKTVGEQRVDPAAGGSDVSPRLLDADREEGEAAVRKCAGVNGGKFWAEKANASSEGSSLAQGEAAALEAAESADEGEGESAAEELLSIELATMPSRDFECSSMDFLRFRRKFGLPSSSGHYPRANFENGPPCAENNVVWLYPEHDHNGAFGINSNVCHRLMMWSQHACSVSVRRIGSIKEAQEFLSRFPEGSIMHLVIGGHGNGYALQWGGSADGWFGVEKPPSSGWHRQRVPIGSVVRADRSIQSLNANRRVVTTGDRGYVGNVDGDGDAIVYFDGAGMAFVSQYAFGMGLTKVNSITPTALMGDISTRMQPHGSVFTDSCLSATGKYRPNLASWVAKTVGKGVRVIGSEVSFGKVDVKRFQGGWHASLNTPEMMHAQRVFVNSEAKCPGWAKSRAPEYSGNCECRTKCRTRSGKLCPAARNKESGTYFLPQCGESWAEDPCQCLTSSGELDDATAPELPSTPGRDSKNAAGAAAPSLLFLALFLLFAGLLQD